MLERLRQVAVMVKDLEEGRELYRQALGLEACHSQDLSEYGLTNMVLPAGNGTFIELLQPTSAESPGARFLNRRGEAPYLLVFETKEYERLIPHLKSLGVRITGETEHEHQRSAFVHPASANGAFLEIVEVGATGNPWPPAGPEWHNKEWRPLTRQVRQVAVLVRDLEQAIQRWGEMFGLQVAARHQISFTDLEIVVMPLAGRDTFIELAQPKSEKAPSARFLERYGEGIYLVIYQIDDSLAMDDHIKGTGLRYTSSRVTANYTNLGFNSIWLHPGSMKGAFTQLSQVLDPENPWPPAGGNWYR
ncbi:MAG: VOC family protein [Dehalococcoidia bacterium]|nr:VOC family protein [Dehalococcoidia bacterium]